MFSNKAQNDSTRLRIHHACHGLVYPTAESQRESNIPVPRARLEFGYKLILTMLFVLPLSLEAALAVQKTSPFR